MEPCSHSFPPLSLTLAHTHTHTHKHAHTHTHRHMHPCTHTHTYTHILYLLHFSKHNLLHDCTFLPASSSTMWTKTNLTLCMYNQQNKHEQWPSCLPVSWLKKIWTALPPSFSISSHCHLQNSAALQTTFLHHRSLQLPLLSECGQCCDHCHMSQKIFPCVGTHFSVRRGQEPFIK